jgi:hypothetical protein
VEKIDVCKLTNLVNTRILDVHRPTRKGDEFLCMTKLDALSRIHVKTPPLFTKTPPLFFQNKNYFTKTSPLLYWQNGTFNSFFLLKRWYHVWYLLIQNVSSKFIYCIYTCLIYIRRQRTCYTFCTLR